MVRVKPVLPSPSSCQRSYPSDLPSWVEIRGMCCGAAGGLELLLCAPCRAWQALASSTRARSLVAFHKGRCVALLGVVTEGCTPDATTPGPICQQAVESKRGNYLANLVLFPGAGAEPPVFNSCSTCVRWQVTSNVDEQALGKPPQQSWIPAGVCV